MDIYQWQTEFFRLRKTELKWLREVRIDLANMRLKEYIIDKHNLSKLFKTLKGLQEAEQQMVTKIMFYTEEHKEKCVGEWKIQINTAMVKHNVVPYPHQRLFRSIGGLNNDSNIDKWFIENYKYYFSMITHFNSQLYKIMNS